MRFASRYIMRSLRCRIGEADSEDNDEEFCEGLGELTTPFELLRLEGR